MQEFIIQAVTIARNIWRFRWYAMLVTWLICAIGWTVVFKVPDKYEAKARIYVDSDSMLKPLLRGLAIEATDFRTQLGLMTKQLLSRQNLEKVMRMVDLDVNAKSPKERETILADLEKSINLQAAITQRPAGRPEPPNLYEITSRGDDAVLVKNIVQSLLTIFLETAIGQSRGDTVVAQKFLDSQINEYEAKLIAAENRLMEFKRNNMGVLPTQGVGIFQRLQTARTELSQIELQLLEATNRRHEIQRQMNNLSTTGQAALPSGITRQLSPLEQRIAALQQRLDELQMRFTGEHPDVRETKQTLVILQNQQKEKEKVAASGNAEASPTNPVYQQMKIALSAVEAEVAGLQVRKDAYQQRLTQLEKDVKVLPEIEAELQKLDRDYEINREHYNSLVKRRESAKMAGQVEESGEEVKFRVIDPPRVPIAPTGPNRPLLSTAILFLALGGGLGLAFLISQIKPVFYDRRAIQEAVQLPVFGIVSRVWTPDLLFKRRSQFAAYLLIGVVLMVAYGGVVYLNLKGIDATSLLVNRI